MTYIYCKKLIENGKAEQYVNFLDKLDVFLLGDRITQAQYDELITLYNA